MWLGKCRFVGSTPRKFDTVEPRQCPESSLGLPEVQTLRRTLLHTSVLSALCYDAAAHSTTAEP